MYSSCVVCYLERMRVSYLGIINRQRLRAWVPETEHAARFLLHRSSKSLTHTTFWTTLDEDHADQIGELLSSGYDAEALTLLGNTAIEYGRLLPFSGDSSPLAARLY